MLKQKKLFLKNFFLFIIAIVILAGFGTGVLFISDRFDNKQPEIAQAAIYSSGPPVKGDNVSGWAWSSNIGWISFNSTDCDSNCSVGGPCTSDGNPPGCPVAGTLYPDYGVTIDNTTGNFSGYAWSSNVGWISFKRADTGDPPSDDPGGGTGPIAKLDLTLSSPTYGKISGWAKILSLGDDGWIRFSYSEGAPQPFPIPFPFSEIGVGGLSYDAGVDPANNELFGWAWNGNDNGAGIGWISLNCINELACSVSSYKVIANINQPPTITANNSNVSLSDPCHGLIMMLGWNYSDPNGDTQEAYWIQIFNGATLIHNSDWVNSSLPYFNFSSSQGALYNENYRYLVNVKDSHGAESGFSNPVNFSTPDHQYPQPYFIWSPVSPSAGEEVYFQGADTSALSQYFDSFGAHYCDDSSNCSYQWTFYDKANSLNVYTGTNDIGSSTIINFPAKVTVHAELKVTDSSGYSCSTTTSPNDIGLKNKLPQWIETK